MPPPRKLAGVLTLVLTCLIPLEAHAQPRPEQAIHVSAGVAVSNALEEGSEQTGSGLYLNGEYVLPASSWIGFRPYTTLVVTWSDDDDPACSTFGLDCRVSTRALLVGGKGRVVLPIPYFAPFIEMGAGLTMGSLVTRTAFRERRRNVSVNLPFALGIALGKDHTTELGLAGIIHPGALQATGMLTLGFTFPIGTN